MAHALPVTKLAGLLVKTFAKPLSKRIKHEFSKYKMTQRVLIRIGQTSHSITSYMTIWSAGYRVRSITPLEEEKALSVGAEFVGEGFVFLVSGSWLVYEYKRGKEQSLASQEAKRAEVKAAQASLQAKLHALDVRLKALEDVVKRDWQYNEPPAEEIVPIDSKKDYEEALSINLKQVREEEEKALGKSTKTSVAVKEDSSTGDKPSRPWWSWSPWNNEPSPPTRDNVAPIDTEKQPVNDEERSDSSAASSVDQKEQQRPPVDEEIVASTIETRAAEEETGSTSSGDRDQSKKKYWFW